MEQDKTTRIEKFYTKNYKKLLFVPIIILCLALVFLGFKFATTGEFIQRDVSLQGGTAATIYTDQILQINQVESSLSSAFPSSDIAVRQLADFSSGRNLGYIVEATDVTADEFKAELAKTTNLELTDDNLSLEEIGSSLGASFFKEMMYALLFAIILMAIVVFIAFRKFVPSIAVIASVIFDLTITLAIISLFGMKLSSAGIAAFLMVLGYSIDTDILLTTRVLKRRIGSPISRMYGALKTGATMTFTTLGALLAAVIITNAATLREMFIIIIVALIVDFITTWFFNTGLLMTYLKRTNEV